MAWRFSAFYFFYYASVGVIVPFWSLYLADLGFSKYEIGELTAILVITKIIAPFAWGWLADHFNVKRGQSLGLLRWATAGSLMIFLLNYVYLLNNVVSSYWWMAFTLFGFSVFWNASIPQVEAATLNYLGGQRIRYGAIRLWGSVGFIVMVLTLGYLLDVYSSQIILHVTTLSFVLLYISSLLLRQAKVDRHVVPKLPLKTLLNPTVLWVFAFCIAMQITHAPFYAFFSLYLESHHYSKAHTGWLWTVGVLVEIGVFLYAFKLLRQYRLLSLLSMTFLIAALRWFILGSFPQVVEAVWVSQILHAITYGLHHSVMIQLVDQLFQGRYQVRGQALYLSLSFGLGGAIGSFLGGHLWSAVDGSTVFLAGGVLMSIVTLLSYWRLAAKPAAIPIKSMDDI